MAHSNPASPEIIATETCLASVITDIQGRPDYVGSALLKKLVVLLTTFRQELLTSQVQATAQSLRDIRTLALSQVQPGLAELLNANIAMANMGQLNTKRILPPATVQNHNAHLQSLMDAVQKLVAALSVPVGKRSLNPMVSLGKSLNAELAPPFATDGK